MLRAALDSLASVFARDVGELRSRLRLAYAHDWSADPFAGGAYSYGGVGAIEARAALVRPVADTLFLAGEAVAQDGRNATVHGALISGRRAADGAAGSVVTRLRRLPPGPQPAQECPGRRIRAERRQQRIAEVPGIAGEAAETARSSHGLASAIRPSCA